MGIQEIVDDAELRGSLFPVTKERIFLGHAGVCPLPQPTADAMNEFNDRCSRDQQETPWVVEQVRDARKQAAALIGAVPDEISLLGPTSLGLNLVANGTEWYPGDEILCYRDDYPANVYPWTNLRRKSVEVKLLRPEHPGAITWPLIESALTERTRMVALATSNFLSGYRIDIDTIGRNLRKRDILFCVDGIQTLGAFPFSVEHVDFLSADAHKWMLGPSGAGVFYVKTTRRELLRPSLLGSWNVVSPQFVAQDELLFEEGGRRYEPGMLNLPGIVGMAAALRFLRGVGIEAIGARILELRKHFLELIRPMGYRLYIEDLDVASGTAEDTRSGIISVDHPRRNMKDLARHLAANRVSVSLRQNRFGLDLVRFSPHFYNTEDELTRVAGLMEP